MIESAVDLGRRFGGLSRLYGEAGARRIATSHVCVVGVGGVGSWAAEALARSAVGAITLIDLDHIAESNTNRQIHALDGEYGRAKVQAMASRILAINPCCRVSTLEDFVSADNVATLLPRCDLLLDVCFSISFDTEGLPVDIGDDVQETPIHSDCNALWH